MTLLICKTALKLYNFCVAGGRGDSVEMWKIVLRREKATQQRALGECQRNLYWWGVVHQSSC